MPYQQTIQTVERELTDVFAELDQWFDRPDELRRYQPTTGWTIDQVLEHVGMTNHFLMLTLRKYVATARHRAQTQPILEGESDLDRLTVIGQRGSFNWPRPAHMEPVGKATVLVRTELQSQLRDCLGMLGELADGSGSLCKVTMTVNRLGKIDLYQWMYFLAQHGRRHLQQMQAIKTGRPAS